MVTIEQLSDMIRTDKTRVFEALKLAVESKDTKIISEVLGMTEVEYAVRLLSNTDKVLELWDKAVATKDCGIVLAFLQSPVFAAEIGSKCLSALELAMQEKDRKAASEFLSIKQVQEAVRNRLNSFRVSQLLDKVVATKDYRMMLSFFQSQPYVSSATNHCFLALELAMQEKDKKAVSEFLSIKQVKDAVRYRFYDHEVLKLWDKVVGTRDCGMMLAFLQSPDFSLHVGDKCLSGLEVAIQEKDVKAVSEFLSIEKVQSAMQSPWDINNALKLWDKVVATKDEGMILDFSPIIDKLWENVVLTENFRTMLHFLQSSNLAKQVGSKCLSALEVAIQAKDVKTVSEFLSIKQVQEALQNPAKVDKLWEDATKTGNLEIIEILSQNPVFQARAAAGPTMRISGMAVSDKEKQAAKPVADEDDDDLFSTRSYTRISNS